MDSAQIIELRERLTALKEGRLPNGLGGESCSSILYNIPEETATIAVKLARLAPDGRRRGGNRQVLFRSEDLPLLP